MPRLIPLLTLLLLISSGCASIPNSSLSESQQALAVKADKETIMSDEGLSVVDPEIRFEFATGTLRMVEPTMTRGYSAASKAGWNFAELKALYEQQLWPLVVNTIASHRFGDDFHYFLLGLSAERLGYPDAAQIYYQKSIEQSSRPLTGKCLKCASITLPDMAEMGYKRVTSSLKEGPSLTHPPE